MKIKYNFIIFNKRKQLFHVDISLVNYAFALLINKQIFSIKFLIYKIRIADIIKESQST